MTEEKRLFIERLTELVRSLGYPEHGKQSHLAAHYKITQGAVRKWFSGESMPAYEICVDLCKRAQCHYEWLMTGRGARDIANTEGAHSLGESRSPYLVPVPQIEPVGTMRVVWVDEREDLLLSKFRQSTEKGREMITEQADIAPKQQTQKVAIR
jgi:hypothetical protein